MKSRFISVLVTVVVSAFIRQGEGVGGGRESEAERLELNRRMREGAKVRIVGNTADFNKAVPVGSVVLDWPAVVRLIGAAG